MITTKEKYDARHSYNFRVFLKRTDKTKPYPSRFIQFEKMSNNLYRCPGPSSMVEIQDMRKALEDTGWSLVYVDESEKNLFSRVRRWVFLSALIYLFDFWLVFHRIATSSMNIKSALVIIGIFFIPSAYAYVFRDAYIVNNEFEYDGFRTLGVFSSTFFYLLTLILDSILVIFVVVGLLLSFTTWSQAFLLG